MAARITASCHSNGIDRLRENSCQYCRVDREVPVERIARRFRQRLVRSEHQEHRLVQQERVALDDMGQRGIGGEPQHGVGAGIADVVAAGRRRTGGLAVIACGTKPDTDPRAAAQGLDAPEQHHRREHAPVPGIARRAVRDPHRSAVPVEQGRLEDRSILQVGLLAAREVDQLDTEGARHLRFVVRTQQVAEHRIRIELRQATPDHRSAGIDRAMRSCSCRSRRRQDWARIDPPSPAKPSDAAISSSQRHTAATSASA